MNTVPGAQSVAEDTDLVFSAANGNAVTVADLDHGETNGGDLVVTAAVTNGSLTLGSTANLTAVTGNGGRTVTLTGTAANINAALNGLTYRGDANFNTETGGNTEALTLTTRDQGNTGSGGELTDSDTVAITVTGVNDAPVNTVPGAQSVAEDTDLVFSAANGNAVTVADLDHGETNGGDLVVTAAVTNGSLTLGSTANLTAVTGNGGRTVTLTGTAANINAALNGLTYRGDANFNTETGGNTEALTLTTRDQGNTGSGGELTDSDTVAITVTGVNDAPVNTVPGAQSVAEDTDLVFSAANGNAVTVADLDHGETNGGDLVVTAAVTNGSLTLGSAANLTAVTGNGGRTVTLTGTAAHINAALNGLTYRGDANFNTETGGNTEALTLTTRDQGNTGSGGELTDSDTVAITVTGVNDAPVNTVPGAQSVAEDTDLVFSAANGNAVTVADLDHVETNGGDLVVTAAVTNGSLTLGSTANLTAVTGNGGRTVTLTGTAAHINAALNGLTYRGDANFNTETGGNTEALTLTTRDQGQHRQRRGAFRQRHRGHHGDRGQRCAGEHGSRRPERGRGHGPGIFRGQRQCG